MAKTAALIQASLGGGATAGLGFGGAIVTGSSSSVRLTSDIDRIDAMALPGTPDKPGWSRGRAGAGVRGIGLVGLCAVAWGMVEPGSAEGGLRKSTVDEPGVGGIAIAMATPDELFPTPESPTVRFLGSVNLAEAVPEFGPVF